MSIEKFACKVCGEIYDAYYKALECEMKPEPVEFPAGSLFKWYKSNSKYCYVIVTEVRRKGHVYDYSFAHTYDQESNGTWVRYSVQAWQAPTAFMRYGVSITDDEFWCAIRFLASKKLTPRIAWGDDGDFANLEWITIDKLFTRKEG